MWHLVVELQGHVTVTKNTSRENVVSNSTEEEKIVMKITARRAVSSAALMRPVCGDETVLRDQQYMHGVKSLLMITKVLLMRKDLVPCCFNDRCNDRSSRFSHTV